MPAMPTFYFLRDGRKTRGPMDADSARLLLTELGVGNAEIAEVRSGAPGEARVFGPAAEHALWTDRSASPPPREAELWLTTEASGWPGAERLGIVAADRTGAIGGLAGLRAEALAALTDAGRDLGADAVVAVSVATTALPTGGLLLTASGTAVRLG